MSAELLSKLTGIVPERNARFSDEDAAFIADRIASNVRIIRPYSGTYRFSWLLSDWDDPRWITFAGKKTRQINGEWRGTADVLWNTTLVDGALLTDAKYSRLLETFRRAAALYREGLGDGQPPAITTWSQFCGDLILIGRWIVLQGSRYQANQYGLKLLDQAGLRGLFAELGTDGWTGAAEIGMRIICAFHIAAFGQPCPEAILEDIGTLPADVRDGICEWLRNVGAYARHYPHGHQISRRFIAELISAPRTSLSAASDRLTAILRQFEPDLHSAAGLLVSTGQSTELPSHKVRTTESALLATASASPINQTMATLGTLLGLYRHIPEWLPDPMTLDLSAAAAVGFQRCTDLGHTPMIPLDVGLSYLNEALRWVNCYGDALVDFYIEVATRMVAAVVASGEKGPDAYLAFAPEALAGTPVPPVLAAAGFRFDTLLTPNGTGRDYDRLRANPTLHQALRIWSGAVVIVLAITKPSRESEVAHLRRDCLLGSGPYWLESELAKRNAREFRGGAHGKPIPTIAARAIRQLQRLGGTLVDLFNEADPYVRNQLFYLPHFHTLGRGTAPSASELNTSIDLFCDYVGLPPDALGRRWYLRIHEMRKWFLLLLFWAGRFDVLDAAREVAGHVDVRHLYAYIEREFGVTLSALEAQYAADRLRAYDETRVAYEGEMGLNDLYERVLEHFKVPQLEMLPLRAWTSYVKELRAGNAFHLDPFTITNQRGDIRLCVAFRSLPAKA